MNLCEYWSIMPYSTCKDHIKRYRSKGNDIVYLKKSIRRHAARKRVYIRPSGDDACDEHRLLSAMPLRM